MVAGLVCILLAATLGGASVSEAANQTYHVDDNSMVMSPDGLSWNSPFKYLQDALDKSEPTDTIKVAGGIYRPDEDSGSTGPGDPDHVPNDESETFSIKTNVIVRGGYAGLALPSTPDVRNIAAYPSVLSGEIGSPIHVTDNTDCIVTIMGSASGTELDGLTIENGHTNHSNDVGVGIGMEVAGSTPVIQNCIIQGNTNVNALSLGAGMFIRGDGQGSVDAQLINCEFTNNSAARGGAIGGRNSSASVNDCLIYRNRAESEGGGIWMTVEGGNTGLYLFENCIIDSNTAGEWTPSGYGGGVYCDGPTDAGTAVPTFRDCFLFANQAWAAGGGMYLSHAEVDVIGCRYEENTALNEAGGYGGGIYVINKCNIINTTFYSNYTIQNWEYGGYGGGIYARKDGPVKIVNSLFHHNISGFGGGMYADGGSPLPAFPFEGINCTFSENTAVVLGGGFAGFLSDTTPAGFVNSIFWGNTSGSGTAIESQVYSTTTATGVTYSCIQDDAVGGTIPFGGVTNGNIDEDPIFRNTLVFNYRLKRCSPAIDVANTPAIPVDSLNIDVDSHSGCGGCTESTGERIPDLDLRDRVIDELTVTDGGIVDSLCVISCDLVGDLGVYEFGGFGDLPCEIMGDMNGDGVVNGQDIPKFTKCVTSPELAGDCACGDMNGNGITDAEDTTCFIAKLIAGVSDCDGVVLCDEGGSFSASSFNGLSGPAMEVETMTWSELAAAGVAASAATALQDGGADMDDLILAARWLTFENWVSTHSPNDYPDMSSKAFDAWATLQFKRIVLRGQP